MSKTSSSIAVNMLVVCTSIIADSNNVLSTSDIPTSKVVDRFGRSQNSVLEHDKSGWDEVTASSTAICEKKCIKERNVLPRMLGERLGNGLLILL